MCAIFQPCLVVSCTSKGNHDTRENTYFVGQWQTILHHILVWYLHGHARGLNTLTILLNYCDYHTYRGFYLGKEGGVLDRYRKFTSEHFGPGIVAQNLVNGLRL